MRHRPIAMAAAAAVTVAALCACSPTTPQAPPPSSASTQAQAQESLRSWIAGLSEDFGARPVGDGPSDSSLKSKSSPDGRWAVVLYGKNRGPHFLVPTDPVPTELCWAITSQQNQPFVYSSFDQDRNRCSEEGPGFERTQVPLSAEALSQQDRDRHSDLDALVRALQEHASAPSTTVRETKGLVSDFLVLDVSPTSYDEYKLVVKQTNQNPRALGSPPLSEVISLLVVQSERKVTVLD